MISSYFGFDKMTFYVKFIVIIEIKVFYVEKRLRAGLYG